ncbi:MAG: GH32 C-terminal domain-containing protein [Phycisphaerales bacterium]|nr:MAG: GH32 C-terminal domain-containing protein [Phycisphaerales bacterium]
MLNKDKDAKTVRIFALLCAVVGAIAACEPATGVSQRQITDKTLVVWVAPADLEQRGGSALTLDDMESHFDGIIFGELAEGKWMAGSDFYNRSQRDQHAYPAETADKDTFVQIAIVYKDKSVTIYRNGERYSSYKIDQQQTFGPGSVVMFGKRHVTTSDTSCFRGRIDDARIYDRALAAEQIAGLRPEEPSDVPPLAWWTFSDGQTGDRMGNFPETYLTGGARMGDSHLILEGDLPIMVAAPKGFLARALEQSAPRTAIDALVAAQRELRAKLLSDPHRPIYHFVSPEGRCMPFDGNGAIYWNGRYHLCYIFQDHRGHCWGHASSRDLLHWRWHSPALFPAPGDVDRGIFSGNCFVNKDGDATILYHGVGAGNCIATCGGPELENWTKLATNPIIPIPKKGSPEEKLYSSWDPHGWLEGDTYYAIFGGSRPTLFKADTLDGWEYVGPFLTRNMPGVDDFEDISCPDFFRLGDKHMLLCISHARGCRYYLGHWKDEQFHPEMHARMNWPGGTCFAPESLLDNEGRRIMWAWVLDRRGSNEYGWSGTMTLPRVLSLNGDGTLRIEPIEELKQLRMHGRRLESIRVTDGLDVTVGDVSGDCLELDLTIKPGDAKRFGIKVRCSPGGEEHTVIECDPSAKCLTIDVSKSSADDIKYYTFCMKGGDNPQVTKQVAPFELKQDEPLRLRIFLDRSILELFANARQCITQRIYPTRSDSLGLVLFSEGGSVEVESLRAWQMAATNHW